MALRTVVEGSMMRKKLPDGAITALSDRRWKVRSYARCGRTGKNKEIKGTLPATMTRAQVEDWVYEQKEAVNAGILPVMLRSRKTVRDCSVSWLEHMVEGLKASTATHYANVLATRVLPVLGDVYVDALVREDIVGWVEWAECQRNARDKKYAHDTLHGWWRVLVQFIRDICADYKVSDPTYRVRPPKSNVTGKREDRTLTASELSLLLDQTKDLFPERYAEVLVLAHTGLRAGELFALRWTDIDDTRGVIVVTQAHWKGVVAAPKTGDPREVALSPEMSELLRAHRHKQIEDQHPGLETGLVFPANNGEYRTPSSLHKPLKYAAEAAGIKVKVGPHVLRRTYNTLMIQAGVDRAVLRAQMGHCSEAMTLRYAGIGVEAKQEALRRLQELTRR